ncbi:hypothetical protein GCM10027612_71300 [Microbispora bryophytorum subsp. camponoti]
MSNTIVAECAMRDGNHYLGTMAICIRWAEEASAAVYPTCLAPAPARPDRAAPPPPAVSPRAAERRPRTGRLRPPDAMRWGKRRQRQGQTRQPVDTGRDVLLLVEVRVERLVGLAFEPRAVQWTVLFVGHERDGVPARVTDLLGGHDDDRAQAVPGRVDVREAAHQTGPTGIVAEYRLSATVHPHDGGRSVEGAPHQADAAVLAEVGDRLGVAAGEIQVGHGEFVDHGERTGQALG